MKESLCWSFNVLPSIVDEYIWSITYEDVRTKAKLRLGELLAMNAEVKSNLIDITQQTLTSIFGKPKGAETSKPAEAPKTRDEALTMKTKFLAGLTG